MAIALAALVARLQSVAPPKTIATRQVPSDYMYLAEDGVAQVGLDAPMIRRALLPIVAGQATYTLPEDFQFIIDMDVIGVGAGIGLPGAVILGATGHLVPTGRHVTEQWEIAGSEISFYPTPSSTYQRSYRYAAGHVLGEDGTYPRLTADGARAALTYGRFLVFVEQAGGQSHSGWSYTIGNESVSKTGLSKTIDEHAKTLKTQYDKIIESIKKEYGSRSEATITDYIGSSEYDPSYRNHY